MEDIRKSVLRTCICVLLLFVYLVQLWSWTIKTTKKIDKKKTKNRAGSDIINYFCPVDLCAMISQRHVKQ